LPWSTVVVVPANEESSPAAELVTTPAVLNPENVIDPELVTPAAWEIAPEESMLNTADPLARPMKIGTAMVPLSAISAALTNVGSAVWLIPKYPPT
jgi:hypothetical protein